MSRQWSVAIAIAAQGLADRGADASWLSQVIASWLLCIIDCLLIAS